MGRSLRTVTITASGRVRAAKEFCLPVGMELMKERTNARVASTLAEASPRLAFSASQVDVGVAVEGACRHLNGTNHARTGSVIRRTNDVIHSGVVVEIGFGTVNTQSVCLPGMRRPTLKSAASASMRPKRAISTLWLVSRISSNILRNELLAVSVNDCLRQLVQSAGCSAESGSQKQHGLLLRLPSSSASPA